MSQPATKTLNNTSELKKVSRTTLNNICKPLKAQEPKAKKAKLNRRGGGVSW
jgi:hypothetical protein